MSVLQAPQAIQRGLFVQGAGVDRNANRPDAGIGDRAASYGQIDDGLNWGRGMRRRRAW